jgi:hypothetical protein
MVIFLQPFEQSAHKVDNLLLKFFRVGRVFWKVHLPTQNQDHSFSRPLLLPGHGTRTEDGTRILAILISVIETCRVRQQSPWLYLVAVIRQRRAGFSVPGLPLVKGG